MAPAWADAAVPEAAEAAPVDVAPTPVAAPLPLPLPAPMPAPVAAPVAAAPVAPVVAGLPELDVPAAVAPEAVVLGFCVFPWPVVEVTSDPEV